MSVTVLDLIRQLVSLPRDAPVVVRTAEGFFSGVGTVREGRLPIKENGAALVVILDETPLCDPT